MEVGEEPVEKFNKWLDSVVHVFIKLSLDQQEATLKRLISESNPELKYVLTNYISDVLQHDIISFLPNELKVKVFSYVDGKSLLTACRVNKHWNRVIQSLEDVWHVKCLDDGFQEMKANSWKEKYLQGQRFVERIHTGQAFVMKTLRTNMFGGDGISELFVNHEYLFASAGKQVSIWHVGSCASEIPVLYFTARHRISSMCEYEPRCLVCGHTSGHLTTWAWEHDGTAEETAAFVGHIGPVTCVVVSKELGLISSGGADCVVKLWCLESKQLLLKLVGYPSIVRKIILIPISYSEASSKGKFVLLVRSKNLIKLYQWSLKPSNICGSCKHGFLEEMLNDVSSVVIEDYVRNSFPDQFCFARGKLIYVRSTLLNKLVMFSVNSKKELDVITLADKCPRVLAVGEKFALLTQETVSSNYGFALISLKMKAEVVKWSLPVPRCDRQLRAAVPSSAWLDDLGSHVPGQLMLAFTDTLEQIKLVYWNAHKTPD